MTHYTVTLWNAHGAFERATRYRFDAFQFQAHRAVYEAARRQALLDTKTAWRALHAALAVKRGGRGEIKLGNYTIVVDALGAQ